MGFAQMGLPRGSTLARLSGRPSHVDRFNNTSCMVMDAWIKTQIFVPRLSSLDGPKQLEYGWREENTMRRIDHSVLQLRLREMDCPKQPTPQLCCNRMSCCGSRQMKTREVKRCLAIGAST